MRHLLDHPSLRTLDFSYNLIGDKGAKAISQLLLQSRLETLQMSNNSLGEQGAQAIAQAVSQNPTLQSLNLRLNRLQDEGGEAIARALLKNTSLCHLHLGANELTGRCAAALAKALLGNTTLKSLNLSCNNLGVVSRSDMISHNQIKPLVCVSRVRMRVAARIGYRGCFFLMIQTRLWNACNHRKPTKRRCPLRDDAW